MVYRVILINTDTKERRMTNDKWRSRKKAIEWANAFCKCLRNADFEIINNKLIKENEHEKE